jgi:hypothetical protein
MPITPKTGSLFHADSQSSMGSSPKSQVRTGLTLEEGRFEPSVPLMVDTDAKRSKPGLTDEDDMRVRPL